MTTIAQAYDAVMELIRTAWLADAVTEDILLVFEDVPGSKPPAADAGNPTPWARVALRHNTGEQETLGAIGNRRFLAGGNLQIQIFVPNGGGHRLAHQIVGVLKGAIRAAPTTHSVWFFDTVVSEIGVDGPWFNTKVDTTFRYEERA
jgi:hypothetical protein